MANRIRSSKMRNVDYIILGQGIAGSNLSYELLKCGKEIVIFDNNWQDSACLVAAGVINPITGQRLVKSWRSALAHPYAKEFYKNLENKLSAHFFHDRKILQLCKSPEEHELWQRRNEDTQYADFIGEGSLSSGFSTLNDKFGYHFIERSAWVEPASIMPAFAKFFHEKDVLKNEEFDYSKLKVFADCVEYGGIRAKGIIFCEGWQVVKNPYFSWLPYRPAKGEILQIKAQVDIPEYIIHRGNWVMKCGADEFRIGSTWDRENLDSVPTESARTELLKAVDSVILKHSRLEITRHSAGVRPCTATTRPHLGAHPKFLNVFSFNGFGSKGYALSPYFAKQFVDYLDGKSQLDSEADLKRHIRKFFRD